MIRRGFLLAAAVCLAGCAVSPLAPVVRPARDEIRAFSLEARLALTRGQERVMVNIDWQHDPPRDEINLRSPLGQTLAVLRADDTGARLLTADQGALEAPTLDALAERALGTALPLSGLPHWVLGRARPGQMGERDGFGRWVKFFDEGWQVSVADYESDARDALPRLIDLSRGEVRVRIRLDQWVVH